MLKKLLIIFLVFPAFSFSNISEKSNFSQMKEAKNADPEKTKFIQFANSIYKSAALSAAGLSEDVFLKALNGFYVIKGRDMVAKPMLTIVDFNKPSTNKRLWVIDLKNKKLIFNTLVAHGKNSGENMAEHFSNKEQSFMSSLGFYLTKNTYCGKHGLSLVLKGLEEGVNSNAERRAIVMHGASYVSEQFITTHGRLGRSHGCPAVPEGTHAKIIESIKDGSVLFIHRTRKEYQSEFFDNKNAIEAFSKEKLS